MKKRPYRGKSFYKLIGAFFIVTLICSGAILGQYLHTANQERQQLEKSYHSMVEKSMANTAATLSYYQKTSELLSEIKGIDQLAKADVIPRESEEVKTFFNDYVWTCRLNLPSFEQPMFLYFRNSGRSFGNGDANVDPVADGMITDVMDMDMQTWDRLMETGDSAVAEIIRDPNMDFARFFFIREIYPGVVWLIGNEDSQISETLRYYYLPEGSQTIFITQNDRMISSDPEGEAAGLPITYEEVCSWEEQERLEWNGIPYFVYHQGFANETLQQVIVIPDNNARGGLEMVLTTLLATLLVSLLVGGGFSYLFAHKLYKPMEELMDALPSEGNEKKDPNEFRILNSTVQELYNRAKSYEAQLSTQSELLTNSLLTRLVIGEIQISPDILEALRRGGFPVECSQYIVFLIQIDETEEGETNTLLPKAETVSLLKQTCRSFFLNQGCPTYVVCCQGLYAGVADMTDCSIEDAAACAEEIRHFMDSELRTPISVAISAMHTQISELHEAYGEAMQVVEYSLLAGEYNTVSIYDSMANVLSDGYGSKDFLGKTNKLANTIQSGNYAQASELVHEIAGDFAAHRPASLTLGQMQFSYLTDAILLSLYDSGADPHVLKELDCDNYLRKAHGVDSLGRRASHIFTSLEERKVRSQPQERRIEQITQYIEENYQDINLSAGAVAERFHMSLPVLSNLFKQELNIGFLDYLHKYRIERAKDLILHTDHTIGDISAMVGYANSITMNRAFKRYEGVTPGWYRQKKS